MIRVPSAISRSTWQASRAERGCSDKQGYLLLGYVPAGFAWLGILPAAEGGKSRYGK